MRIAVLGATGVVGQEILSVLEQRAVSGGLTASARVGPVGGQDDSFRGRGRPGRGGGPRGFGGSTSAGQRRCHGHSRAGADAIRRSGAILIDNSSAFRMQPDVPLVVPEVNPEALASHHGIIANPNCVAIILTVAVAPIHRARRRAADRRLHLPVGQRRRPCGDGGAEVAGAASARRREAVPEGAAASDRLQRLLAQRRRRAQSGYNGEETKVMNETRKILSAPRSLAITATCVRVPVLRAHSESVNLTLSSRSRPSTRRVSCSPKSPGIEVVDDRDGEPLSDAQHRRRAATPFTWAASGADLSQPEGLGLDLFVCSRSAPKGRGAQRRADRGECSSAPASRPRPGREAAVVTTPTVLVATWHDGLFIVAGETLDHELRNQSVRALAADGRGGALAIVNGHSLNQRAPDGVWSTIATTELDLACCVAVGDVIYVGTDDARVVRVGADGAFEQLLGFDAVAGRETWYAGSAVINGQRMGPPLGIRSITATQDGAVLLANVHVGGIPRSADGGATWQPTIAVESDVHEVRAHPNRPGVVMAAAGIGLCISRDGGMIWEVEQQGLHASYCSAVAFAGDDVFVSASVDHFAAQGALYRRPVDGHDSLVAIGGGLPEWTDGIVDTGCIATRGSAVALVDRQGNLYVSADTGRSWARWAGGLPPPSGVLIV